jgi:hypothetical protein
MKKFARSQFVLSCVMLTALCVIAAGDVIEVDLNESAREFCHVLRFPLGWQMPRSVRERNGSEFVPPNFALDDEYEFRISGLQGTKFLIRGSERIIDTHYTTNIYEADFSDPSAVAQPATEEEWKIGTVVSMPRDTSTSGARVTDRRNNYAELDGRRFTRTGDGWGTARLSPDRTVLVVESWSGTLGRCGGSNVPGDLSLGCIDIRGSHGKLFFDVYNTGTGKKVVTLTGKFSVILPGEVLDKTGWVTERYFIVPLDQKRERCLVCEFGQ